MEDVFRKLEEIMKKDKVLRGYILITPVKNEEKNLSHLIRSVINQTIKPSLWVIIDDGSADNTPNMIKKAREEYEWIQSIRLDSTVRDRLLHLANVVKKGFDFALEYCRNNGINYNYLGNVDADVLLEKSYFESLIKKFEENPILGLACGGRWIFDGNRTIHIKIRLPYGGALLIRKECFEDCGGIPQSYAWDSVLNIKAILKGWEIKRFNDIRYFSLRPGYSAEGLWKGNKEHGEEYYFLGFNLFHVLIKGLKMSFKRPYYPGFAYLYGYFKSLLLRKKKINDKEIRYYYKYIRPQEIQRYYFDMLKNKLKRK